MKLMITYSKCLKPYARELRRNMTVAEQILWARIRRRQICGVQFFRQRPIQSYIVDFYAKAINLVIELDGEIHNTHQAKIADANREYVLSSLGLNILRFTNHEVMYSLTNVLNKIEKYVFISLCNR